MRLALALAACSIAAPGLASAQGWPGPAGTGSITVVFQTIENTGHFLADGSLLRDGKSRNAAVAIDVDYAVTDRLSLSAGIPYVFSKFIGPTSLGPVQPHDACRCWQSAVQDATIGARFALGGRPVAFTPSVAVVIPSHDYEFRGEAVPGRKLSEVRLGVAAGHRIDALSPRLSVQGSYSYAVVQRVLDVPNNRSNAAVQIGFSVNRAFEIHGSITWQRTHGGLRTGAGPPPAAGYPYGGITTFERFVQHDRLLRDNSRHAAFGLTYASRRLGIDLFTSYVAFLGGTDTHAGRGLTAGVTWPFEWRRP
jgi:hypothetical protein